MILSKKTKIAFVPQPLDMIFPPEQSSIGIWTYEVASRMAQSCEVIVYSGLLPEKERLENGVHFKRISPVFDRWLYRILNRFSKRYNVRRPLFASKLYYLTYALQVAKDLRNQHCDIVHVHNLSQFVPVIRALNPKVKIVLHMHGEWLSQLDPAMIERRLRHVDLILGCSDYVCRKIKRTFPQFAGRCRAIHNGVDVDHFCSKNGHMAKKDTTAKRLLFVGRLSPEKGLHTLLDAFQIVAKRLPQVHLDIVGPEALVPKQFLIDLSDDKQVSELASFYGRCYKSQLQERLSTDLASRVSFGGPIAHAQLSDRYCNADVFVFPSVCHEAFGMPVIEAMACGIPVVASRSGGITEIITENETGVLVERGNASALAEA
ncbi:MAG: glycosyltransferase family 4 protein, partial [bacterium]